MLGEDIEDTVPPVKSRTFANPMRRKATILPMHASAETRTPEGFSLQRFIEENQKKMEEKQMMLEGNRIW